MARWCATTCSFFFIRGFAWLAIVVGFIGGVLTAEWIYDRRHFLRSRLRSLASKFRLSMAIFWAVAFCLAATLVCASLIRDSFCASVSERWSSISRKNFSCLGINRHCKTPPNIKASDAPKNISQTCIQSNSAGMVLNSETNSLLVQERMISILSEMGRFFFGNTQSVHIQRFMHFVDMHLFFGT